MNSVQTVKLLLAGALLSGLAGCGDGGVQEVKQWMDEVRSQSKVSIPKLAEPKRFTPFVYTAKAEMEPFNPAKLSVALAKAQPAAGNGLKPDFDRRREPLESYPLDQLKMVGTLEKEGRSHALLQADRVVHRARVGSYLGQNFGVITKITETEVELKEIVQDASGDWVERKAKLELQEAKK